jgi:hypothetical protein
MMLSAEFPLLNLGMYFHITSRGLGYAAQNKLSILFASTTVRAFRYVAGWKPVNQIRLLQTPMK